MKTLTIETLRRKGACESQVKLLQKMFGDSAEVTEERCLSVAHLVDFEWAADHLLDDPAEYERVRAAEHERIKAISFARLYNSQDQTRTS